MYNTYCGCYNPQGISQRVDPLANRSGDKRRVIIEEDKRRGIHGGGYIRRDIRGGFWPTGYFLRPIHQEQKLLTYPPRTFHARTNIPSTFFNIVFVTNHIYVTVAI